MKHLGLALLSLILVNCSTAKMAVPADIAGKSDVLEVSDRSAWSGALADESFRVGPYHVADVDRDWDSTSGFSVGGYSQSSTASGYTFKFKGSSGSWAGKCAAKASEKGGLLGGGFELSFQFAELACSCSASGNEALVVIKSTQNGNAFEGKLTTGEGEFSVSSISDVEGGMSSGKPSGYRADKPEQGPLGAVDVIHPGRIWLNKSTSEAQRQQVTCLFAGLMLYKPKDD